MQRYRRLIPYILRQWPALGIILALTVTAPLVAALAPWPLKLLVDGVTERQVSPRTLIIYAAAASLALFALSSALDAALSFTWAAAGQRMVYDVAADMFAHLQRLSLLFHSRHSVGDSLARLSGDSYSVYTVVESLLITPAQHALTLLVIGLFAWSLDPVLTLVSLSIAPILAGSVVFFGPRIKRRAQLQRKTESQLVSFVHQTLSSVHLVQAFSTQSRNVDQYREIADGAVVLSQQAVVMKNAYSVFVGFTSAAGIALVVFVGSQRVLSGALSVGGLLVFVAYLRTLQAAVQGLLQIHGNLRSAEAGIDRVLEILESTDRITEAPAAMSLAKKSLDVTFQGVSFGYAPERPVLQDINLHVEAGTTLALVGATGAGKTTLLSLVPRLFDAWSGHVRVGGQDVRELTLKSLRAAISVVPQDPLILPISVEANIAYGRPGASGEEIRRAAEAAGAAEFIEQLPEGYRSVIGERGATLSGGQRQRLAIARAILKDAPILILDEPTSSLDAGTEHEVMSAIERLMCGRTCLVIAHRLSTVRRADRVVVLEHGRIVEDGTHDQLMSRPDGVYRTMRDLQFLRPAEQEEPA
jgi:ATP-binding cassette subfamily B protein